ncbi:MAG TPA: NADH-quinone oxidoreductase subunit C [Acidimicrobiales bacterium]|nr:NADH-quinone oxidoreductase subunit C [Acidimicrobiales bacterium]
MSIGLRRTERLEAADLHSRAAALLDEGFSLACVAAHDDVEALRIVYVFVAPYPDRRVELSLSVDPRHAHVPTISDLSFAASRFEREFHDTFGIVPDGHAFLRALVRHAHWPETWYPMREGAGAMPELPVRSPSYPFIEVAGGGVYEIPVGPIHAGLIEPGHFRFSVVGETIVKMTARLWFVHRGVERMFQGLDPSQGVALAERVSGDSAVGHALAYAMAIEDAWGVETSPDARALRSLLLEMERIYNHVTDLGAMANDVSFGVAHARAMSLRESLLRLNESLTGHRLLRGAVTPGVTSLRRLPTKDEIAQVANEFEQIVDFTLANTVVRDRFEGTAVLSRADALAIGTLGVVARASGLEIDARREHPFAPRESVIPSLTQTAGDVMARYTQRVQEVRLSLTLISEVIDQDPQLHSVVLPHAPEANSGLSIVEGWRGMIVHRVELDAAQRLTRCRIVDPSFSNWPALSTSLANTIVPDFPLANKSFNLSYAGNDL